MSRAQQKDFRYRFTLLCLIVLAVIVLVLFGIQLNQLELTFPKAHGELTKEQQATNKAELEKARLQAQENANPIRPPNVETNRIKIIVIQLSNSCLSSLKANYTTNCPGYELLTKFDTTNPSYSGSFIEKNGHTYRDSKGIKSANYYFGKTDFIICVDCKHLPLSKYKQIIIVPDLPLYKKDSDKKVINNTIIYYKDRGVDPNCQVATIRYTDFLVNDTIKFLKSNCTQTEINEKVIDQRPFKEFDISTSKAYQYQKWLQEMKTKCKTKC